MTARKQVYFNQQMTEDAEYVFERMKAFGLLPAVAAEVGEYRAKVVAYVLRAWVEGEQQRLVDIEALERNESVLVSEIAHVSRGGRVGEEEQGEHQEYLAELWDELHETQSEMGKL